MILLHKIALVSVAALLIIYTMLFSEINFRKLDMVTIIVLILPFIPIILLKGGRK